LKVESLPLSYVGNSELTKQTKTAA